MTLGSSDKSKTVVGRCRKAEGKKTASLQGKLKGEVNILLNVSVDDFRAI